MASGIIFTADDLGISKERNCGILESVLNGVVSSVSLMVNGPSSKHAVDLMRMNNKLNIMGLHFNITEGFPISDPTHIPTLVEESKSSSSFQFLGKVKFYDALREGRIDPTDVAKECEAQVILGSCKALL
jgi:chitin disaccharide deacetylase